MNKTYMNALTNQCIEIATDLGLIKYAKRFDSKLTVTFTNCRHIHAGGYHLKHANITYGLKSTWLEGNINYFQEYKRHAKSLHIGSFVSESPTLIHKAVVCHEMAHAIQFWNGSPGKPHGSRWRILYRALRDEWVNPYI